MEDEVRDGWYEACHGAYNVPLPVLVAQLIEDECNDQVADANAEHE